MKKVLFFSSLLLCLVTACRKDIEYETLSARWPVIAEVYALKDNYPDSAMKIMDAFSDSLDEASLRRESSFQYYEYQVLSAELCYKNYRPITNDSLVVEAHAFYDSVLSQSPKVRRDEFLVFQQARSTYYLAVVESRKGMMVESYSHFLTALKIMDRLTGKDRVFSKNQIPDEYEHFTALIYTRLASFLNPYDAWDVAFEVLEMANKSFEAEGNGHGVADNLELMGDIMIAQSNRDSALYYYKASDSIHYHVHVDNVFQHYSTLIHNAIALYDKGENDSVYAMLHHALDATEDDYLHRKINYSLGYFYYADQNLDSALSCYEHSFPLLPRQTINSLCKVVQISNDLGYVEKAAKYADTLADFYFERAKKSGEKTKMITMYEQYKSDKRDIRRKDTIYFILLASAAVVFLLVWSLFWIERRNRKHKQDKEKQALLTSSLENQIKKALEESQKKDQKISELEAKLEKIVSNPDFQNLPFDMKMETLRAMPISKRVMSVKDANVKAFSAYPELLLSDSQLSMLVNAVDTVFPKFSVRIIEMFPRLKRADVVYCCFYILGVSEVQAAALTGKTYQAVWTRSLKLHDIFDNKSNLQFVLHSILKNW